MNSNNKIRRNYWIDLIEKAWQEKNVIWLAGVRRSGKTFLSQSLDDIEYFDCEIPRVRNLMDDPEMFLNNIRGKRVILDEIHRLPNPTELLKIGADYFPDTKILATGSSSLASSMKFRDTLTGRRYIISLTPAGNQDMVDFEITDLSRRLQFGGLPPYLLSDEFPERSYQDWMDAFWSKDIETLFSVDKRDSFLKFAELLLIRSSGLFEATRFARECSISRQTVNSYLTILENTFFVYVIRPFSSRNASEIVLIPKVYAFDTGFVCCHKSISELRPDDYGFLWEHLVLNELTLNLQSRRINFWRDKRGHEIDFVIVKKGVPMAIECKWKSSNFEVDAMLSFKKIYPKSRFYAVCGDMKGSFVKKIKDIDVEFIGLEKIKDL